MQGSGSGRPATRLAGRSEASLPTECRLCPRACGANRAAGERGVCGAADELRVARAALHHWEEPVVSVGAGSGAVFFSNCPLRCCYCQNADIASGDHGIDISVGRLADILLELQAQHAGNVNLVTACHYAPQVKAAVAAARSRGLRLPVVYNTSGYETVEAVDGLAGTVDVYLTDFKYWRDGPTGVGSADVSAGSDEARAYSHAPDYFDVAVRALDRMADQTGSLAYDVFEGDKRLVRGVVVRHLLLPGRLEESKRTMAFLWERYGDRVLYSVMSQYTPVRAFERFPELSHTVDPADYEALLDFMDGLGMEDYFWQQGGAAKESFIPAFDCTGVLPKGSALTGGEAGAASPSRPSA